MKMTLMANLVVPKLLSSNWDYVPVGLAAFFGGI